MLDHPLEDGIGGPGLASRHDTGSHSGVTAGAHIGPDIIISSIGRYYKK
jgi:hypothetical protein